MKILSVGMLFSLLAIFYTSVVLLPNHHEMTIMKGSIVSAILNVLLNLALLKGLKQNGAAFTTLIAELYMFLYEAYKSRSLIKLTVNKNLILSAVLGCIGILTVTYLIGLLNLKLLIELPPMLVISAITYGFFIIVVGKADIREILGRE